MKLIGFIKQHDAILDAVDFLDFKKASEHNPKFIASSKLHLSRIYFRNCPIVFGWMNYFKDLDTGEIIEPQSYYSDGEWIWPSYFMYYLNKFNSWGLYQDFFNSIENKKYHVNVSNEAEIEAEIVLLNLFKK
ncbi:hypothetical protein [Hymenobacter baengnokdamensis]|uniref:hypothetical protein n=1 Tax=Hymenobacter baengnokdamensis TaxID=2615203 RepID=UPI001246927C|nr:hypothetical protein [Hymenobacter baengnokdamensis]